MNAKARKRNGCNLNLPAPGLSRSPTSTKACKFTVPDVQVQPSKNLKGACGTSCQGSYGPEEHTAERMHVHRDGHTVDNCNVSLRCNVAAK